MTDIDKQPSKDRQRSIIERIQTYEHDVLTTTEVAEGLGVGNKQARRDLKSMRNYDIIAGRQFGDSENNNQTWLWWVSSDHVSAHHSVATAREVARLVKDLYERRWEFRLIAVGGMVLPTVLLLALWAIALSNLGVIDVSITDVLALIGSGSLVSVMVIFIGLFIFPIETLGDWSRAREAGKGGK